MALLAGTDTWHTAGFDDPPVAPMRMSDGPAGVRGTSWTGPASASFPCGTALGATWDPGLVRDVGRALGREAHSKNAHILLAPTVNLHRTPISGRNFEFPSEDPVLAAAFAVAYVRGVQDEGVACCIKHFVANETEFERMTISSEVDERTLRELYFVPFEAAVHEGGVRAVMSAYNRLNGTYCADHQWLLTEVLRGDWGFDGVVVSDWFGNHSTVESLRAGLDIEMPGPPLHRGDKLRAALAAGEVEETELDPAVERILALVEWTKAAGAAITETTADDPDTRAVIRRAAARGSVLLKNEGSLLPLGRPATLALVGPYARFGRQQGGGSARVTPDHGLGPLDALRQRGIDVRYETGGSIAKYLPTMRGDFVVELSDPDGAARHRPRLPAGVVLGQGAGRRHRRHPVRRPHQRNVLTRLDRRLGARRAGDRRGGGAARRRDGARPSRSPRPAAPSSAWAASSTAPRSRSRRAGSTRSRSTTPSPAGRWCGAWRSARRRSRPATPSSGRPPRRRTPTSPS